MGLPAACSAADYTTKDSLFALIWGEQLAGLGLPDFDGTYIPTPHPLANLVGALVSPLGIDGAELGLHIVMLAAFVLMGVAAFRLGRALFVPAVGALFAVLLLTRPEIVKLALSASIDVPFLALILLAAALEAERPRRGAAVLVTLALAGLLRPEAWIMSVAYAAYLLPAAGGRARAGIVALGVAAPVAWLLVDLALTGDPLFSFNQTGGVADVIQPDTSLADSLELAPRFIEDLLGPAVFWGGVAGSLVTLFAASERMPLPAALVTLSLVPFLAYGAARLTLYPRFLLPTAAMLALFCATAVAGWAVLAPEARHRRVWAGLGALLAAVLVGLAPATLGDLRDERRRASERRELERSLRDLVRSEEGPGRYARCRLVLVPDRALVPALMRWLDKPATAFAFTPRAELPRGLQVTVSPRSGRSYVVNWRGARIQPWQRAPLPGLEPLAENRSWRLDGRC